MPQQFNGQVKITNTDATKTTIVLDGNAGDLTVGGLGQRGDVYVRNSAGKGTIVLSGEAGGLNVGGIGQAGEVVVRNSANQNTILLSGQGGDLTVGSAGQAGDIRLQNSANVTTIHLDAQAGDIILENADCAEEFDIAAPAALEPGTVVVLDDEGKLGPSAAAYDRRVAGVISGAGDYRPGIVLDRQATEAQRQPVALVGKVYCKVDASFGPIAVGDLLTTAPTAGHAMKASDAQQAFGAVLGKALRPLPEGRGLIPILVALQ